MASVHEVIEAMNDAAKAAEKNARLRKVLAELIDIIDQGDTSEVWQVALLAARAELAAP